MKKPFEMPDSLEALLGPGSECVIFSCIAGSHAYGTAHAGSDEDVRGLFVLPASAYLALTQAPEQLSDERNNTIYYSVRRFVELAVEANPSILELLHMPADCVRRREPEMERLIAQRPLFVTKRAYASHVEYARAQIHRARGQNKWVNNPQPEAPPEIESFCWFIPRAADGPPLRPVALRESGIPFAECRAAAVEHMPDCYRLYRYGPEERGVLRGGRILCESVPKEDEAVRCVGLLYYHRAAHERAVKDHRHYWQWRENRNESRWTAQEKGVTDYDVKNLMHTFRLLFAAETILRDGIVRVRAEGEDLAFLKRILAGEFTHDALMALAEEKVAALGELHARSSLDEAPDSGSVTALLAEVTAAWEARHA